MTTQIKTVNIRGKNYVEVAERVRLVHDQKREFELVESEPFSVADRWLWRVKILVDGKAYKGNAEVKLNAPKNTPDGTNPFECAETSALGRALAFAGLGTVESIASFDEVYRAMQTQESSQTARPNVQARASQATAQPAPTSTPPAPRNIRPAAPTKPESQPAPQQSAAPAEQAVATDQQKASISKLCQHVQMSVPDLESMSFVEAKALITELTAEYKKQRAESQAQPAPAPTPANSGQSKALLDMIGKAKSRVEALGVLWDDAKSDAGLRQVADTDLSPKQVAAINAAVAEYEQRQAKAS